MSEGDKREERPTVLSDCQTQRTWETWRTWRTWRVSVMLQLAQSETGALVTYDGQLGQRETSFGFCLNLAGVIQRQRPHF